MMLAYCISRGFHVVAEVGGSTVVTVRANYCRDCGVNLTPKTLPTTEDYR